MLALKTYLQKLETRQKEKQTRKGRLFGPLEDEAALNTHRVITRLQQIKVLEKCVDEGSRRCSDSAWMVKLYLDSKQRIWLYEELSAGLGSDVVYSPIGKFDLCCNMWNYDKRLLCASRVWKYALNLDLGFRHYKRITDSSTDLQSYYDEGLHCFRAQPKWLECKQMHQLYESHKDDVNEYLDVLTTRVQKKWPPDDVQRWKEALLLFSSELWYKNKDLHFGWPMKSQT